MLSHAYPIRLRGRPPKPESERKSARHTYRCDAHDEAQLDALKRALNVDDDSEAIRTAISLALAQVGGGR